MQIETLPPHGISGMVDGDFEAQIKMEPGMQAEKRKLDETDDVDADAGAGGKAKRSRGRPRLDTKDETAADVSDNFTATGECRR